MWLGPGSVRTTAGTARPCVAMAHVQATAEILGCDPALPRAKARQ
jgi:hypothetical protein